MKKQWILLLMLAVLSLSWSCKNKPAAQAQPEVYDSSEGSVYDNGSTNGTSQDDDLESSGISDESEPLTYTYGNEDSIESETLDQIEGNTIGASEHLDWGPIYFDFDASDLTDEARRKLNERARYIIDNRNLTVLIEGHCDQRGTEDYNLALGERRAQAVKQYLQELGVPAGRLSTISYGERRPEIDGENESSWRRNRRVTFAF